MASERTGDARGSCKQRTFAPAAAHQSKQTRHLHLSGAVFPSRPYNSGGPTVTKLRHYSQSDHSTASTVPWRHGSTGCQSSVFFVAVTCYPGFILRHRFLKPPARTQTPLAVRRIRWCTWQACAPLDIAVGSVLRLAECPSGRRRTTSAAASQKLSICCPAERPCPEPINPRTLGKPLRSGLALLTTTAHMHDGRSLRILWPNGQDATSA